MAETDNEFAYRVERDDTEAEVNRLQAENERLRRALKAIASQVLGDAGNFAKAALIGYD